MSHGNKIKNGTEMKKRPQQQKKIIKIKAFVQELLLNKRITCTKIWEKKSWKKLHEKKLLQGLLSSISVPNFKTVGFY